MQEKNQFPRHVTWQEAEKSWLKARGRSLRASLDSVAIPRDGASRYVVAAIATIALASSVGLSGVIAGPDAGKVLGSSLSPISGVVERLSGVPGSGAPATAEASVEGCGEVAADTAAVTDVNADASGQVSPSTAVIDLTPIINGGIPLDIPTVPPVGDPPVIGDPGDEPPVVSDPPYDPPTDGPPTGEPPTDEPPTDQPPAGSGDNLVGADLNLGGQDVLDIGLLQGDLLDVNADSLDPNGSGTGTDFGVDLTGNQVVGGTVDPQDDGIADINIAGNEIDGSDVTDSVGGGDVMGTVKNAVEDVTNSDPVSNDPVGDLLGDDPVGDLLGGNGGLGGLLN